MTSYCDEGFYDIHPGSWQSRSWLVIVDADAVMEDAIDITLDVVAQECDTDGSVFSSTTVCDDPGILRELKSHWENDSTSRNGVQLVTTRNFDNSAIGCGYILGISDPEDWAYTAVKAGHTSHLQGVLGAHELGHNMYGEHDDADSWWDWGCFCTKSTIMYHTLSSNTIDEYSSTNYNTIRTEAEAEL